jgi:hypothetical protein
MILFLLLYLVALLVYALGAFFIVFHINKFGVNLKLNRSITVIFLFGSAVLVIMLSLSLIGLTSFYATGI